MIMSEADWNKARIRAKRVRVLFYTLAAIPLVLCFISTLYAIAFWWSH